MKVAVHMTSIINKSGLPHEHLIWSLLTSLRPQNLSIGTFPDTEIQGNTVHRM